MKRIISVILSLLIMLTSLPAFTLASSAAEVEEGIILGGNNTITRAEWLHNLVETFDMYVEEEAMPDNYFTDLDEYHYYYEDIILAVEFGVVNIPAGGELKPDDPVTRDFAVSTLNFCLGYQLEEGREYTFTDFELCSDPDSAQIALDRGWVSLAGTLFRPDLEITDTEIKAMTEDAASVLEGQIVDPDYQSEYTYAEDVIVIPDGTDVAEDENGNIIITDCEESLLVGDKFAVYLNGIPSVYTAVDVAYEDNKIIVTPKTVEIDDAFEDIDAQGVLDADAMEIIPAEGVEVTVEEEPSDSSTFAIKKIDKKIEAKVEVPFSGLKGSVSASIKNPYVDYSITGNRVYVALCGDATITYKVSGSLSGLTGSAASFTLFHVNVAGIGGFDVDLEFDISGSLSGTVKGKLTAGVECQKGSGIRLVKNFVQKEFYSNAEVEASVSLRAALGVTKMPVLKAEIYAEVGMKCNFSQTNYKDGSTPKQCTHFGAYLYAKCGAYASAKFGFFSVSESVSYDIYSESNSPVRIVHHYEDKVEVPKCTRGNSYANFFTKGSSRWGGSGWMGANGAYGLNADGTPFKIYDYELDDNGDAIITQYNGNSWSVYIPKEIDGYKVVGIGSDAFQYKDVGYVDIPDTVTSIGAQAFYMCRNLRTVNIPNSVTSIGYYAFYECSSLSSVSIPTELEIIDDGTFSGCSSLKSVTIPNSVTEIYENAFSDCTSLKNVTLSKSITYLAYHAFSNTAIEEIEIPKSLDACGGSIGPFNGCSKLKKVTFEKGVTQVPEYLFAYCTGIESITIPDTVTVIEEGAFFRAENLNSVTIPDSVTTIGYEAFYNCTSLKNVTLSKSITYLAYYAFGNTAIEEIEIPKSLDACGGSIGPFNGCSKLKKVTFEKGVTQVPEYLFAYCTGIESITIPDTVTVIEEGAFFRAENLNSVTIPDSVTTIENDAFWNCSSLSSVVIPNSVTTIGYEAFYNCTSLKNVTLSKSITYLAYHAFSNTAIEEIEIPKSLDACEGSIGPFNGCSKLKKVTFEKGVTQVPEYLFAYCTGIESITIPDTVTVIEEGAFFRAENLNSVTIPDSVTTIENDAFWNCSSLSSVVIPNSVTTIGYQAFYNCTSLKSIEIPDSVTSMGYSMFSGGSSLESAKLPKDITSIPSHTFEKCTSLKTISIPSKVKTIDYSAFSGCTTLESFSFPEGSSLKEINSNAFYGCTALKEAEIPFGVETIGSYAFKNCVALEKVTIPRTVKNINNQAFMACEALKDVIIADYSITEIKSDTFKDCPSIEKIVLPKGLTKIGSQAFMNCTSLFDVAIPESVTSIETNAFSYPDKTTIRGRKGSYAETFANDNGFKFADYAIPAEGIILKGDDDDHIDIEVGETYYAEFEFYPEDANDVVTLKADNSSVYIKGHDIQGSYSGDSTITATTTSGMEYEFTVHVRRVNDIRIITNPAKTTYLMGESLDTTGMEVQAVYNDGYTRLVEGFTTSGFDSSKEGQNTVTVKWYAPSGSYYTKTFTVNIVDPTPKLTGIFIESEPTKTAYALREKLDLTGMVVKGIYTDGSKKEITDYTTSGYNALKKGTHTITVTYEGFTDTFTVTVGETPTEPTEPVYKLGDVDLDGNITVVDATWIQCYLAELKELNDTQLKVADTNKNNNIDILDATQIQRFLAELIPAL